MSETRFRIRKHCGDFPSIAQPLYPWRLTDRSRPAYLGQYTTHERAVAGMNAILRLEHGFPLKLDLPVDEIRAAMRAGAPPTTGGAHDGLDLGPETHPNCRCAIEPVDAPAVRVLRGATRR
jgi:hypothetical protein